MCEATRVPEKDDKAIAEPIRGLKNGIVVAGSCPECGAGLDECGKCNAQCNKPLTIEA